jgi:formylglycine-generating enzyme required for sulfatase activity
MVISTNSNAQSFKKGDVNQDGRVDISDVVAVINIIANGGGDEIFFVNGVSFTMVHVDGGTFQMGSEDSESLSDEQPVHQVTLSTFSIGQTEVTQELWEAVMGTNPSYFKGAKLPVEQVSWYDCQTFFSKLNSMTGKQFRLPTEAEWEYVARGGNRSKGYTYSGSNNIGDVAWYDSNSGNTTHEVATKAPNELGVYDMSGNVWEICHDWFGSYRSSSQTNPVGPSSGTYRVRRGGGWNTYAKDLPVTRRFISAPDYSGYFLGLRLAL